ncbi:methylitaconate delta2-delta3-isomerase [Mollisia scopiformis]|uniref:Methylitaconate delta2-delta3-isomerase n=1 Tax=Mollisia scopiformis TaxID=149040 RepID=A0A132B5V0_MOLSC|nr:methylitaconate delta2-delta3-isomerase [Mollisia scopiformis]KUJ07788.1 methylitaconate delta2-delta3-isomerase [Mollisia scopiformis]
MILQLAPHSRGRRKALPAVMMRAGTSKGLFIHRHDLPASETEWAPILLSAMGSRYASLRQIDGVGGATSTTSKIAVIGKSERPGVDVEYTFVQVAVGESKIDMSGTCGNMASGVAPFAVDEGLVDVVEGQTEITIMVYNTNTKQEFLETIQLDDQGRFKEEGDFMISGVPTPGSRIDISFVHPAGSMKGKLLPTGNPQDIITIPGAPSVSVRASLVDASNPIIFVDATTMPAIYHDLGPNHIQSLDLVESIRRQGAVLYGLASSIETAALVRGTPKIAMVSSAYHPDVEIQPDITVLAYSMGKMHPTLQLTGAVCLSAAASIPGSVVAELVMLNSADTPPRSPERDSADASKEEHKDLVIKHPSGVMSSNTVVSVDDSGALTVESVSVYRTASRLFEGYVYYSV